MAGQPNCRSQACDRHTDRHTTTANTSAGIASCGKKNCRMTYIFNLIMQSKIYVACHAETPPRCKTNLSLKHHSVNESDVISVECDVRYRGNWAPVISCEPGGRVVINSITDSYRTYVQVIFASHRIHGQTIICTTTFTTPSPSSSSIEDDVYPPNSTSYTWASPIIHVVSKSTFFLLFIDPHYC